MKFGCAQLFGACAPAPTLGPPPASCGANARVRSKELQVIATENANWASFYLDYKALKQILGQLSPRELDAQSEGNAQGRPAGHRARV